MTNQEELQDLLNRSVAHVRAQGEPSVMYENPDDGQTCMYRSHKGLGCAAAPFITDYHQAMDGIVNGGSWSDTFTRHWSERLDPLAVKHQAFVRQLQVCHDEASKFRASFMAQYEKRIAKLAERTGLTVPVLSV